MASEYWNKYWRRPSTRRRFLGTSALAGAGAASFALVGCGDDDDDDDTGTTPTLGGGSTATTEPGASPSPGGNGGGGALRGGTARYPLEGLSTGDPPTLYPFENLTYLAQHPATLHYSRLLTEINDDQYSPDDYTALEGDIAEGLPEQPDELTYVFKIRPNVAFHNKPPMDGRMATATDVKNTYDAFIATSQNAAVYQAVIDSVEATDETTLTMKLKSPFAPFLTIHASTPEGLWFIPVETITNGQVQTDPVGTGPFVFREWETGVAMRWDRHDAWHKGPDAPYVDAVEASLFNDPQRILAALSDGSFDWSTLGGSVYNNAQEQLDTANGTERFGGNGSFGAFYFNYDNDGGRWRDKRLRQALSMSMDRAGALGILDQTGQGDWFSACCPTNVAPYYLSPQSEEYGENAKYFQYNPTEAKALMQAATGSDQVTLKLTGNIDRYGQAMKTAIEFYASQMREVGWNIEVVFQEYGNYIQSTYLGQIPDGIGIGPLIGSPRDPNDVLSRNMESTSARHNWGGSPIDEMPRIDEMIAEQRTILDLEERIAYLHDMQREMAEYLLVVPYTASASYAFANPWVNNWYAKNSYSIHYQYAFAHFNEDRIAKG